MMRTIENQDNSKVRNFVNILMTNLMKVVMAWFVNLNLFK